MNVTPLVIEIMLHYHCTNLPFDPQRINAPAVIEVHKMLEERGILNGYADGTFTPNRDAISLYIMELTRIELPKKVWIIPEPRKPIEVTSKY